MALKLQAVIACEADGCGVSGVEQRRGVDGGPTRWRPERSARAVANGGWPNRTVLDVARERVPAHSERIERFDGERQLSFSARDSSAQRRVAASSRIGSRSGDMGLFSLSERFKNIVGWVFRELSGLTNERSTTRIGLTDTTQFKTGV